MNGCFCPSVLQWVMFTDRHVKLSFCIDVKNIRLIKEIKWRDLINLSSLGIDFSSCKMAKAIQKMIAEQKEEGRGKGEGGVEKEEGSVNEETEVEEGAGNGKVEELDRLAMETGEGSTDSFDLLL